MRERVILPESTTGASTSSSVFWAWVSESVTSNSHCGGSAPSKYIGFGGVFSLSIWLKQNNRIYIKNNINFNKYTFFKILFQLPWWNWNYRSSRSTTLILTTSCHFHTHDFNSWWMFYVFYFIFCTILNLSNGIVL